VEDQTGAPQTILAVLAGGRGRRIGGAKATVPLGGRPLIGHVLAAARHGGLEAVVVAKRGTELPSLSERVIAEPDEPRHPLCGILAALDFAAEHAADCAVLVVACDMPFLPAVLLRWLAALEGPVVLELDGALQPLPARCTTAQRPALREALAHESSLRSALGTPGARVIADRELIRFGDPRRMLFGVNRREDIVTAESWLAESSGELDQLDVGPA
jgi:molybdopterin-guanine dinucleotide biosynthesis protein A